MDIPCSSIYDQHFQKGMPLTPPPTYVDSLSANPPSYSASEIRPGYDSQIAIVKQDAAGAQSVQMMSYTRLPKAVHPQGAQQAPIMPQVHTPVEYQHPVQQVPYPQPCPQPCPQPYPQPYPQPVAQQAPAQLSKPYPVPQQSNTTHQQVIVTQHRQEVVNVQQAPPVQTVMVVPEVRGPLGESPCLTRCTHCQQKVTTKVIYKAGVVTWLTCFGFVIIGSKRLLCRAALSDCTTMRELLLLSLLAVAWLCGPAAANETEHNANTRVKKPKSSPIKEEKGVLLLNKSNFDQALGKYKQLLVNFHAPLSGESQSLTLEFSKAAEHLKAESSKVRLGMVDISKEKDLAKGAELIKDVSQAEIFVTVEDTVVLGFFEDLQHGGVEAFYTAATDMPDLPFGVTKNKQAFSKYEITKDSVVLFKKSKKSDEFEVSSEVTKEDLIRFVRVREMELVTEYNGTVLFVFIDTDEHRNGRILEYFRVRDVEAPVVRMVNLTNNVQYQIQKEEITSETVTAFCQTYLDGKAKPKLQSEPVPENWDKKPVKELVGSNFEKVGFNEERNVFVMFYAPWCKKCEEFFQLWEKLGKVYEKHESVVIAKIDATANDINILLQQRYPALMFFPAVFSEKVLPYLGERTLEALVEFVENQVELAKAEKSQEEVERKKYIEAQKSKEKTKEEL
ncbi:hypothetical protein JZ751_028401 [Albula glossodonta]|uniref:protein disulfide-isomerase n=1 Tax=Albula glossodonta TaxID=121402 RepID=A0A8T2NB11_9TELE|nr:hypothetical protein JZ751_028401 [Albula glossodonta]